MAGKIKLITDLYADTLKEISTNPSQWTNFLDCSAMNYKYPFKDQVLIYAQKPNATACAKVEAWNKQVGRWIVKGAKGIALLDEYNGKIGLNFIFDVEDTWSNLGKSFRLWSVSKAYEPDVIESLQNKYGDLEDVSTLGYAIKSASKIIVEDNIQDYLEDLKAYIKNSSLEYLPEDKVEKIFKITLENSVAYSIMKRCGINPSEYFNEEDFATILSFNNEEIFTRLGVAKSEISEMAIKDIYNTIKKLRTNEIEKIRTFDINKAIDYDLSESNDIAKGRNENESNLYETRGLHDTRLEDTREQNSSGGQIRNTEIRIPEETQASTLHNIAYEQQTSRTFDGYSESGEGHSGTDSREDEETGEFDRGIQSNESNGVGRINEQLESNGRGTSDKRTDIHLEKLYKDENIKAFFDDETINNIIKTSPSVKRNIDEIKKFLRENIDDREKCGEYISNIFGNEYTEYVINGNERVGHKKSEKGLYLWKGDYLNRYEENFSHWETVASCLISMMVFGELEDIKNKLEMDNQLNFLVQAEAMKTSVFSLPQEIIDIALQRGSNVQNSKFRIYKQLTTSLSSKENEEFLKNEYGMGGTTSVLSGSEIDEMHGPKGIKLTRFSGDKEQVYLITWSQAEKRIRELINANRYFNLKEEAKYEEWLEEQQKKEFEQARKELTESKEEIKYQCKYDAGDKVYIGTDEYEILTIGENNVFLFDKNYPLINVEYTIEDFERKVRENPANAHLLVEEDALVIEFYNKEDGEIGLLYHILNKHKINDIELKYDENQNLVATDGDSSWKGKEFYDFLFNELFVYNQNGEVELIFDDEFEKLTEYSKKYEDVLEKEHELTGKEFEWDGRKYNIEKVNGEEVELRDITFESSVGMPIYRIEKLERVKELLSNQKQEEITPEFAKKKSNRVTTYDIHPEIPKDNCNQYRILNDRLGEGGPKEKFNRNIEAIKVLRKCESENRFATPEEQDILSQYVGWGGLAQAFDEQDSAWSNEYHILKNLLDEKEYKQARESTLTSFYTPPIVIKSIYKALENMGLKNGNILEPSCGTGNFLGMLPNSLAECKLYGVELDSISGKIAQQLYQKSSIAVQGYEDVNLPNSFFDVAVGNVPFGDFRVYDKKYDKNKFLIHDYFFAKTLDKVRPGGVIAFITSKGTMDKESSNVRRYIAQRADLLGAIRLPNNTFKANAGTEVTSDIIFLQKRDSITDIEPDWVHLDTNENGIKMNKYFVDNPDMIMGNMEMITSRFGYESACISDGEDLESKLEKAITNIKAEVKEYEVDDIGEEEESIEADLNVRNFSYTLVNNKIYYRENSRMYAKELASTTENRIKGLIAIRDYVRTLIEYQIEDYPEESIKVVQQRLNRLYDDFTKKYGLINSRGNNTAFSDDSSYYLLCSLEILDDKGNLARKADMFNKRTIRAKTEIKSVDSASEALLVSLSEKARVDLEFMQQLSGLEQEKLIEDLEGRIFNDPKTNQWVTADEYLSGNVREKLKLAKEYAANYDGYDINVKYLEEVQPKDLSASEISVKLGSTWIPPEDIKAFIEYLLTPSYYASRNIHVRYMESTAEWYVEGKNYDNGNVKANRTYGTTRANAYKIIEDTLNLKDTRVFDYHVDLDGKRVAELNKKETAIAQAKQEQIKAAFEEWIWSNHERRERLVKKYNETFNCIRPREYDGSHIVFDGMNPEIKLRKHQVNAIARILYGGNTLLAHEVGAGKTFEMVAAAMESKRLGLCNKSLFVVPNHIVEQFGQEFLQLYPSANILVTTKKDFEKANRKKFCSRIATGDYDAVIISHSQFEKIPMSIERQRELIQKQISEITRGIQHLKQNNGERFSIKQMMKTQKKLEAKLEKLNDTTRKDDVVTFEELGVDRLFVDEAHNYKNLFLYTKMRNVGGIAQTEAQKSSDLYMKCRYLDELTGGKGIIFATGTPISNSMVELYTMQRYLQYDELNKRNLQQFDAWASTFGETVTAIELSPEGTGYRAKTRFAKFFNLPELMAMFKEVADIQTSDMLNLPVPKATYHNIAVEPSEIQKEMVAELGERAERIRNKMVSPTEDNMLKITNDGRKLALDQRLANEMLSNHKGSKVMTCANGIYNIWQETSDKKSAQLVFCDLSTPSNDGKFNVYDDMKKTLIEKGIPEEEIAFIHDANTDLKKQELFNKVRKGQVRVLMGSTSKMGAGTNCQTKLIALHDLDCPWRPSDLIQRSGRIIRQGNTNPEVHIYRYVTQGTFDAYLYQIVENKQKFISQIMTSKTPVRSAEDIDETALSYAEIKALAAGNPDIIEKTELDAQVAKLKLLKQTHLSQIYELEDRVIKYYPNKIKELTTRIDNIENDIEYLKQNDNAEHSFERMIVKGETITDKKVAGEKLIEICKSMTSPEQIEIGEYKGFKMLLSFDTAFKKFYMDLKHNISYRLELGSDAGGNIIRIENALESIDNKLKMAKSDLEEAKRQLENAKEEIQRPFPQEEELKEKTARLDELNIKLNLNEKDKELIDDGDEEIENSQICKKDYER